MLNISYNTIRSDISESDLQCMQKNPLTRANVLFRRWLMVALILSLIVLFLPWTQNIQAKGKVTTLFPDQRPQTIHATIDGRIEKWFVQEGETVKKGDTIVYLSEIKVDYFDPQLVERTAEQVQAKSSSITAYAGKVGALARQIDALEKELILKQDQLKNKIKQAELKVESAKAELAQVEVDEDIAAYQFRRADTLFQQGIVALTSWEAKKLKVQETQAKVITSQNKLAENENEVSIHRLALSNLENEYRNKIEKAYSDKFSALSNQAEAEGAKTKLENQYENYRQRNQFYYIIAPKDCYITKALKPGIGETVKTGDAVVSIMPINFDLAVELYVRPMDLPLLSLGQDVRFLFDGWPGIVFSGWPNLAVGTFQGQIVAIDNTISDNDKYRILIAPDNEFKKWPKALRPGSGAQGIAMLKDVPLWYEIWRQLNGFPPDFYAINTANDPKLKTPLKSIPK